MEIKASDGKKAAAIAERIMIMCQKEIQNDPVSTIKAITFLANGIIKHTKPSAFEEDKDVLEPMMLYWLMASDEQHNDKVFSKYIDVDAVMAAVKDNIIPPQSKNTISNN